MILYLDTSLLVAALTHETHTARAQEWLAAAGGDRAISDWVITEFSSALSIKVRTGGIEPRERAAALAMFTRIAEESWSLISVQPAHFRTAARFADQHALGLRAGDALHLAICAGHGAMLCTLDRRLAEAGVAPGVTTRVI